VLKLGDQRQNSAVKAQASSSKLVKSSKINLTRTSTPHTLFSHKLSEASILSPPQNGASTPLQTPTTQKARPPSSQYTSLPYSDKFLTPLTDQKIQKRPLIHPPVAAPRTGSATEKIIYVSANSPFISTIKRVRTYLSFIESRAAGSIPLASGHKKMKAAIEAGIELARSNSGDGKGKGKGEEVVLKATGKAIEKLLRVAVFFQGEQDVKVEVRTGSVGAVDDVVEKGGGEIGESRVRRASVLEVGVRLR
jgi:ribonuclease P/MRP protein subunit POP7